MADSKKYSRLPDEYQELEYIQSGLSYFYTGYIDTGLVGTDLYGCEIETCMKITISTGANMYYINGAYESGKTTQIGLVRVDTTYCASVSNMGFSTATTSGNIALNDWHTIYIADGEQKCDDVVFGTSNYGTLNSLNYLLFARTDAGVTLSPPFAMKYFWIKKNGQYIRNMIPAKRKSDNVVGMYDIANDVFYTSENQYAFIGGNDVDYWQHSLRKLSTATDTITTLPADVYADGNNATVGLLGNMSQTGTPSPQNPIQPRECGERTENLFDGTLIGSAFSSASFTVYSNLSTDVFKSIKVYLPAGTYTISWGKNVNVLRQVIDGVWSQIDNVINVSEYTFTCTTDDYYGISFRDTTSGTTIWDNTTPIMLNAGSTPLPYQPYGYKLPIKSANTTTPVYLGEVQTMRRVYKWVLTGEEDWVSLPTDASKHYLKTITPDYLRADSKVTYISSHYVANEQTTSASLVPNGCFAMASNTIAQRLYISDSNYNTDIDFKTYLAQQYANGTPVTVWYVLATETTGIVNEPLRKIGTYADTVSSISIPTITGKDTFDVLTTLKPSEVSLAYTGWHDASVGEWDGSEWQ